jgi:pimeloyl-ACP methyl ester carboxylesterase
MKNKMNNKQYFRRALRSIFKFITGTLLFYFGIMMLVIPYCLDLIEAFEPASEQELILRYDLKGNTPESYGFTDFEEVSFKTKEDIELTGWFIPAKKNSKDCIYFVHGWNSSGLACFPYLEIMKDENINKNHNIFVINLRNSGKSSKARTDLGYKTASDVVEGMKFLKNNYDIENIKIFAISMGAMATLTALNIHKDRIENIGVKIEKLILDSPMSNAKKSIQSFDSPLQIINNLLYVPLFIAIDYRWDYMLDKLRISHMLPNVDLNKVLILQSDMDKLTTLAALDYELTNIEAKVEIFPQGAHARIYHSNKDKYRKVVSSFLKEN